MIVKSNVIPYNRLDCSFDSFNANAACTPLSPAVGSLTISDNPNGTDVDVAALIFDNPNNIGIEVVLLNWNSSLQPTMPTDFSIVAGNILSDYQISYSGLAPGEARLDIRVVDTPYPPTQNPLLFTLHSASTDLAANFFYAKDSKNEVYGVVAQNDLPYGASSVVPEPGTMMLLGSGLVGLAGWGRKRFKK